MADDNPLFKVPKEQDFLNIIKDAEESGILDKNKEDVELVNNPLSWLRFDPLMSPFIRLKEETEEIKFEEPGQRDAAKEIERGLVGGAVKAGKGILEFVTAGIDLSGKTELTSKLDQATRSFLYKHGDPETFSGKAVELLTQYGVGGGAVLKLLKNVGQIKKIKKLDDYLKKSIAGIRNNKIRKGVAGATDIALRSGRGALSLSIADMAVSNSDRETLFTQKVEEAGKTGRDLAVARLANKIKFAQEGAIIGAGIPLVGAGLSLGAKFGFYTGGKALGIGFKLADPLVKGGTKLLALDPIVFPTISKGIGKAGQVIGTLTTRIALPVVSGGKVSPLVRIKEGLPSFQNWRLFSVDSVDPLRATLKKIDNGISYLRSIGRQSPEQANIAMRGEKEIISKARIVEKLLDSLEKRAYDLVKGSKKMYDAKTVSPASQEKYLDEVLEYFKNQRELATLQKELQKPARKLREILDETRTTFLKILPKDSLIKDTLSKNIKGYMRKSFAIFTNPNYAPDESSAIFKDAVNFVKRIISKNIDLKETAIKMAKRDGTNLATATEQLAKDQVNDILRYAKTDNKDPIQILTNISKKKLRSDNLIVTGEELPDVIRKVLGQENDLRNTVLQTISNISTQSTYKTMFDRLGEMLLRQNVLFKSREAAEFALGITPGGRGIRQVGKIDGLGLLRSNTSELFGSIDAVERLTSLKGPLDSLASLPLYKNFLQFKVGAQYGKTVLSPATQTRNFSSAGMFVMNRGLIGNRSSVMESLKMVADDIFNAGKLGADAELRLIDSIEEGIKYGALDENIVASELGAVLRAIRSRAIKDTDGLTKFLETKGLLRGASRLYAGGDNIWKWYGYNWYKSFLTDYAGGNLNKMKQWFKNVAGQEFDPKNLLGQQRGLEEAIKEASAWYVRNTMPTYSLVPRLIQAIRILPIGNFVSFPSEMIRTTINTTRVNLREIASNDKVLREMGYRGLLGQFTVLGGASVAAKGIYSTATGVGQDLMEAYKMYVAPEFQRNSDIMAISKPDDKGRFKIIDLSSFMPYDTVTKPIEAAFNLMQKQKLNPQSIDRFLFNFVFSKDGPFATLLEPFVNKTIFYETVSEVLSNKKKEGGQIYSDLDDFPEKWEKSFKHIVGTIEPGVFTLARQLYYGFREKLSPTGQNYDLEDILFGLGTGVKPQNVDLKKSMEFVLADLKNIRTDAPDTSTMYRFNQTKDQIISDYIDIQRNAFREQQRIHNALKTMIDLNLDEDYIYEEAKKRGMSRKTIDKILDGEFVPIKYSKPRFEEKIIDTEDFLEQKGRKGKDAFVKDEDALFPEFELDDVIDDLNEIDLSKPFPYDVQEEKGISTIQLKPVPQQTSQIQTPPLPIQPQPAITASTVPQQINPVTGLTRTEQALLSPEEQVIRQQQRS